MMLLHRHIESPVSPPASSFVGFKRTGDFAEQAALLQGWNQDYAQLSSGRFEGYVSEMRFDGIHLFLEYTSQSMFQHGQLPEDVIAVGVPLQFGSNGLFCGSACDNHSMHIFSGKEGFEFFSPTQLLMGGISVERDTLLNSLSAEDRGVALQHIAHANLLNIDNIRTNTVRNFMAGVFEMIQLQPQLLENTQNKASLSQTIISLLTDCLIDSTTTADKLAEHAITNAKCWNILAETRELVRKHADMPISVAEVCQQLSISRRTLQYCFQNLLNTTPMAYLRAERLNGVRSMLKTANSVTEAAAHWGFWHFGHFSQEYKKMFGELPSATFKRLHPVKVEFINVAKVIQP
ncbi:MAG: helix-turn-helix domain-containing protein [Methylotenera sp.]|uniref:helix-turn-helix domain-containing protein n=1 Tax=Methylotenera sp. TaxID=2051956 RepID=UPI002722B2ED|nr:helix-turn-helix domain-containing protein [Methylotenera sp.]MDO9204112.1 helix-turn-helix domain-containing protein [Methylotenera sp.]MDO9392984.1 helix-turn-helix domain-containing protein [Methylotenera sp.]MDP1523254.1 helix-turn-helix domain-containing protein [Methylotenera sp.]MDZ4210140.1 helix-turn-helix domain-containing protein [Methylotenera sp.]